MKILAVFLVCFELKSHREHSPGRRVILIQESWLDKCTRTQQWTITHEGIPGEYLGKMYGMSVAESYDVS